MITADSLQHEFHPPSSRTRSVRQSTASAEPPIVGQSEVIQSLIKSLRELSRSGVAALFVGESGTGKGFFARALHQMSPRREHPFVTLTCTSPSAPSEEALTQALSSAHGGTLYIDGIEHLSRALAARLIEALPGAPVQLLASSNQPLAEINAELHALFAENTLSLPSLREHAEDIPLLTRHFFDLTTARLGRVGLRGISPEAMSLLEAHTWTNNATGLECTIEQAVSCAEGPYLTAADLPEELRRSSEGRAPRLLATLPPQGIDLRAAVEELETRMILQALERTGWNKNRAARLLGLNRTTLVEMIKRKRLTPPMSLRSAASATNSHAGSFEEDVTAAS